MPTGLYSRVAYRAGRFCKPRRPSPITPVTIPWPDVAPSDFRSGVSAPIGRPTTVGVPFVGLIAAALPVAELLRRLHGGTAIEIASASAATIAATPFSGSYVEA